MATGAFTLYHSGRLDLLDGSWDWIADGAYAVLLTGHTPDLTDATLADVSADEVTDPDYAPIDLASKTVTNVGGTTPTRLGLAAADFGTAVSIAASYLVIVKGTVAGKTGTDPLLGYTALDGAAPGTDVVSVASDFKITWSSGLVNAS